MQQSVLKIYADQKDSAFQEWVDENNVYLHNLAIDAGEISVRAAQTIADFVSIVVPSRRRPDWPWPSRQRT